MYLLWADVFVFVCVCARMCVDGVFVRGEGYARACLDLCWWVGSVFLVVLMNSGC